MGKIEGAMACTLVLYMLQSKMRISTSTSSLYLSPVNSQSLRYLLVEMFADCGRPFLYLTKAE